MLRSRWWRWQTASTPAPSLVRLQQAPGLQGWPLNQPSLLCTAPAHCPFLPPNPDPASPAGCGVIVHQGASLGLVLVDRNTVTVGTGDFMLSFGAFPAEVPARVRFLHPTHNFALVSYDPRQLAEEVGVGSGWGAWQAGMQCWRARLPATCDPLPGRHMRPCAPHSRPAASSARCAWRRHRPCAEATMWS